MSNKKKLSDIRALTFDVFGTVVDWRSSVIHECSQFGSAREITCDWAAFADDWRDLYQPAMQAIREGKRAFVTLDVLHRENLDQLLEKFEINDLSEDEKEVLNKTWHRLLPWPDTIPGLLRLRHKFILATLSNGNISLMVNLARYSGLPWDAILGAEIAQTYKGVPFVYERTAQYLDIQPHQCMMVAAHNKDLAAARNVGFRTAYVNRPTENGLGQTQDIKALEDWDIVVSSMTELADELGQ